MKEGGSNILIFIPCPTSPSRPSLAFTPRPHTQLHTSGHRDHESKLLTGRAAPHQQGLAVWHASRVNKPGEGSVRR